MILLRKFLLCFWLIGTDSDNRNFQLIEMLPGISQAYGLSGSP